MIQRLATNLWPLTCINCLGCAPQIIVFDFCDPCGTLGISPGDSIYERLGCPVIFNKLLPRSLCSAPPPRGGTLKHNTSGNQMLPGNCSAAFRRTPYHKRGVRSRFSSSTGDPRPPEGESQPRLSSSWVLPQYQNALPRCLRNAWHFAHFHKETSTQQKRAQK